MNIKIIILIPTITIRWLVFFCAKIEKEKQHDEF
nr:MAG TPA: hypothetical protein [Caudoviricetes sp.]